MSDIEARVKKIIAEQLGVAEAEVTNEKAFVADLMPASVRGSAYGAYSLAVSITALPASVAFGLVWQGYGDRAAFLMGAGLALAASVMLLFVKPGKAR